MESDQESAGTKVASDTITDGDNKSDKECARDTEGMESKKGRAKVRGVTSLSTGKGGKWWQLRKSL